LSSRFRENLEEALFPPLVALLVALICGDLLIMSYGQSPATVYRLLLEGTWGNAYGFGQVLYKATTLIFTGLAVSLGIRAGLFNVGAESQLAAGGFLAALLGLGLSPNLFLQSFSASSLPSQAAQSSAQFPVGSKSDTARMK
jgi:simple sugar transport system permease protein